MKIGIIGAGRLGTVLAKLFINAGHTVCLANSRAPESLAPLLMELGTSAEAADPAELVSRSNIVVLAVRWEQLPAAIHSVPDWGGKIVVDATNNRFGPAPEDVYDIGENNSSEVVKQLLGNARLVKAFNHQPITALEQLLQAHELPKGLYIAGDDPGAKASIANVIRDMGCEAVDTGTLHVGGALQNTGGPLAGRGALRSPDEARHLLQQVSKTTR